MAQGHWPLLARRTMSICMSLIIKMIDHQGVGLPDEERVEKETDMAKISNARDIFKQRSGKHRHHKTKGSRNLKLVSTFCRLKKFAVILIWRRIPNLSVF